MRLLLATTNPKKAKEIRAILGAAGFQVEPWPGAVPEVVEDGATFAANAAKKALAFSRLTEEVVLADDSGLEVDALGGRPGVFSHRYAGEPPDDGRNNEKLLKELSGVPPEKRTARFKCALAMVEKGKILLEVEGSCEGLIAEAPRGTNDFGYDPVFFYPPLGKTFAELEPEEKNSISHRGNALLQLVVILFKRSFLSG